MIRGKSELIETRYRWARAVDTDQELIIVPGEAFAPFAAATIVAVIEELDFRIVVALA